MANRNVGVVKCPREVRDWVNDVARFKSMQEKQTIPQQRIMRAMFNQYKKYPELLDEIKKSTLGDKK